MADFSPPFADNPAPSPALQVFLDTSVLIAGIASGRGAAREVLRLGEAGIIRIYLSEQVLTEADRVFGAKFPTLIAEFRKFLRNLDPVLVDDPTRSEVGSIEGWINADDAPILAAAIKSRADCLVTWDRKHFQSRKVAENVEFPIFTPGEFLENYFGKNEER
ncbi:MAG: PIN domain-containing protein [Proteobacteria bacterium]|nr:PIN domain-containing protein [Pseudomonadota bacterium]